MITARRAPYAARAAFRIDLADQSRCSAPAPRRCSRRRARGERPRAAIQRESGRRATRSAMSRTGGTNPAASTRARHAAAAPTADVRRSTIASGSCASARPREPRRRIDQDAVRRAKPHRLDHRARPDARAEDRERRRARRARSASPTRTCGTHVSNARSCEPRWPAHHPRSLDTRRTVTPMTACIVDHGKPVAAATGRTSAAAIYERRRQRTGSRTSATASGAVALPHTLSVGKKMQITSTSDDGNVRRR